MKTEEISCGTKFRHVSASAARSVQKESSRRRDVVAEVYHCRYCGHWHIGSHLKVKQPYNRNRTKNVQYEDGPEWLDQGREDSDQGCEGHSGGRNRHAGAQRAASLA